MIQHWNSGVTSEGGLTWIPCWKLVPHKAQQRWWPLWFPFWKSRHLHLRNTKKAHLAQLGELAAECLLCVLTSYAHKNMKPLSPARIQVASSATHNPEAIVSNTITSLPVTSMPTHHDSSSWATEEVAMPLHWNGFLTIDFSQRSIKF